jgi:hypothetical protein
MNQLYPIIRRVRRPLLPVDECPPAPQPSPPGEGVPLSVSGEGVRSELSGDGQTGFALETIPSLPGGEGRDEGERHLERATAPPLLQMDEVVSETQKRKGKAGGKTAA